MSGAGNAPKAIDPADTDAVVLEYLRKRGYSKAEEMLKSEVSPAALNALTSDRSVDVNVHIMNQVRAYNKAQNTPDDYEESYSRLKKWVESSLDMYRFELGAILWPLFVHIFIDLLKGGFPHDAQKFMEKHRREHDHQHSQEIHSLQSMSTVASIQQNEVATAFLQQKAELQMSSVSHQLLMSFLEESNLRLLLGIINNRITLKVISRKPLTLPEIEDILQRQSHGQSAASTISHANRKPIDWGLLPKLTEIERKAQEALREKEKASAAEAEKPSEKKEAEDKDKTKADGTGSPAKKAKTDPSAGPAGAAAASSAAGGAVPPPSQPALPHKIPLPINTEEFKRPEAVPLAPLSETVTIRMMEDLKARIAVGPKALPSVALYTMLNSVDAVNYSSVFHDGSMMAAGYADAFIRVWDLTSPITFQEATADEKEGAKPPYTKYVGHTGPVYKVNFSHDKRFLLSCSEDSTIRLWSLEHKTPLVAYKGHNFPVWDAEFSPLGFYFASASHDRTARLWSTDKVYPLRIFAGHLQDVDCLKFHPNSNYLATGSSDQTVRLWDIHSGDCVRIFTGHSAPVRCIAISPDGRTAASGGADNKIILWDLNSGRKMQEMTGHERDVTSLDFSMEGSILASGSLDFSVRLWSTKTADASLPASAEPKDSIPPLGSLLKSYRTKSTPVCFVQFTPRNLLLASGVFRP